MTKERDTGRYVPGNVGSDGDYLVGKGKPPESGKFRTGDGRQRGRRRKGTKNLATDLREELDARVTVTVGGSSKKITRQRAILMRLADNATKGQNPAIAMALDYQQRLVEPLFAKEQEAMAAKERPNFRLLTLDERLGLEYLMTKSFGQKFNGSLPRILNEKLIGPSPFVNDRSDQECGEQEKTEAKEAE